MNKYISHFLEWKKRADKLFIYLHGVLIRDLIK